MNRRNALQLPPRLAANPDDEPRHARSSHVSASELHELADLPGDDDAMTCARWPSQVDEDEMRGPASSYVSPIERRGHDDTATHAAPLSRQELSLDARDSETMWGAAPGSDVDRPDPLDLAAVHRDLFDDLPSGFADEFGAAPRHGFSAFSGDEAHTYANDGYEDGHEDDGSPAAPFDALFMPPRPLPDPSSLRPRIAELQRVMERRVSIVDAEEAQAHAAPSARQPAPYAPLPAYQAMPLPPPAPASWRERDPSGARGTWMPTEPARRAAPPFELTVNTLGVILTGLAALAVVVCAIVFAHSERRSSLRANAPTPVPTFDAPRPVGIATVNTGRVIGPPDGASTVPASAAPVKPAAAAVPRAPAPAAAAPAGPPPAAAAAAKAKASAATRYKSVDEILSELGEEQLRR